MLISCLKIHIVAKLCIQIALLFWELCLGIATLLFTETWFKGLILSQLLMKACLDSFFHSTFVTGGSRTVSDVLYKEQMLPGAVIHFFFFLFRFELIHFH